MKKDTLTILMTTLLAGVLEVSFAYAKPPADGAERTGICTHAYQHTRKTPIYRLGKRLGLTQEQRTSVRAIVDQHRPEMRALQGAELSGTKSNETAAHHLTLLIEAHRSIL